jgi:transcriptional regulator with XRE-family HTH domain
MNRTEASAAEIAAFVDALDQAIAKRQLTLAEVADKVAAELGEPMTMQAISNYRRGVREPHRATVFALERVLGLRAGGLSRHLGYLPVTGGRRS